MNASSQIARRDFSAKTLRALTQRGLEVVDVQMLPDTGDLPWANAERGYLVNDHGTGRVWTFQRVLSAAQ
jgi:hypothetical protein